MKRINTQNNFREYLYVAVFLFLFIATLIALRIMPQAENISISDAPAFYDLTQYDFGNTNYRFTKESWESWPERLYAPADLTGAEAPRLLAPEEYKTLQFATHRLCLALPVGKLYGLKLTTSDYAMRIFINGEELDSVGTPGETRETTVPRVQNSVYYFYADSGETEIVVQTSNFVHSADGAWPPDFYIGSQANITRQNTVSTALIFFFVGYMFTAFFNHLGLFCLNRKRKATLVFAISCLLLAFMDKNLMLMFFPEYNWFVAIRFEYIVHFLTIAMFILFFDMLYQKLLSKTAVRAYYALASLYILLTLFTDTLVFTSVFKYFEYASLAMIAYVVIRLTINLKGGEIGNLLSFLGVLVLSLTAANDILYHQGIQIIHPIAGQFFMTPVGMAFFVFCNAIAVSVEYVNTEIALIEERRQSELLSTDNAALDRLNTLKSDLMRTISHEMRTPLAVIMGFAEITAESARKQGVDDDLTSNLDMIAAEAERMADMMEEMRHFALAKEYTKDRYPVDIGTVVRKTTGLYARVLERRGTSMQISVEENLPYVYGNDQEFTQVVFNLLRNADNHTENGNVYVSVALVDGLVRVTVSDTGTGIAAEILPHVFERGVQGSKGGSGFGLAICKDIVGAYGGTIWIESDGHSGTKAIFDLPIHTDEEGATDE